MTKSKQSVTIDPFVISANKQMCYYNAERCLQGVTLSSSLRQIAFDVNRMDTSVYLFGFSVYRGTNKKANINQISHISVDVFDPTKGDMDKPIYTHSYNVSSDLDGNVILMGAIAANGDGGLSYYLREEVKDLEYSEIRNSFSFEMSK